MASPLVASVFGLPQVIHQEDGTRDAFEAVRQHILLYKRFIDDLYMVWIGPRAAGHGNHFYAEAKWSPGVIECVIGEFVEI